MGFIKRGQGIQRLASRGQGQARGQPVQKQPCARQHGNGHRLPRSLPRAASLHRQKVSLVWNHPFFDGLSCVRLAIRGSGVQDPSSRDQSSPGRTARTNRPPPVAAATSTAATADRLRRPAAHAEPSTWPGHAPVARLRVAQPSPVAAESVSTFSSAKSNTPHRPRQRTMRATRRAASISSERS